MADTTSVRQPLLPAHPRAATMATYQSTEDGLLPLQVRQGRPPGLLLACVFGAKAAPRRRPWHATTSRRLLRMALFSLAAAWALWTLVLLASDRRQARALPVANPANLPIPPIAPSYTALPCTADTFARALAQLPPHSGVVASVERVDRVAARGSYGEGAADLGFPANATNLPALCAATVAVRNGSSQYRLGLFLPAAAQYNGRLLTVGSYSFAGGINWPDMGQGPHYGFATLGCDTGHNSAQDALDWQPTTPAALADWGYRSLPGAVAVGRVLVAAYYSGSAVAYSYFSGCSTGGRQGLKAAQTDPGAFDGVLAGAPAWATSRLMAWITRIGAANLPETAPHHLDLAEFAVLAAAAQAQCDSVDGQRDGIIGRPEACVLDWGAVACDARTETGCLTAPQIATAQALYADAFTAAGDFVHSGLSAGSEDQWYAYLAFGAGADFDTRYERFWLYNDTAWDWTRYSDQTVYDALAADPGGASADRFADIRAFRDRGGKLLMYQGLADGVVPPRMTTRYYEETAKALAGSDVSAFFRYFQVPGMQHCFGTPAAANAPWMFAAPGQATLLLQSYGFGAGWGVPGRPAGADHDALLALVAWVESSSAPARIEATVWNAGGSVNRTRPLCMHPQEAVFGGKGNINNAANWQCA